MNNSTLPLIYVGVLFNAIAQILLKEGMKRIGTFTYEWHNIFPIGMKAVGNPFVMSGIMCYVFSVMLWLGVLSRADVSYAYPIVSLGYVVTAIAAYFLMHETITITRMLGIMVIIAGVFLITRS